MDKEFPLNNVRTIQRRIHYLISFKIRYIITIFSIYEKIVAR